MRVENQKKNFKHSIVNTTLILPLLALIFFFMKHTNPFNYLRFFQCIGTYFILKSNKHTIYFIHVLSVVCMYKAMDGRGTSSNFQNILPLFRI